MSDDADNSGAAQAVLELLIAHDLEEFGKKPRAERDAELAEIGYDQAKIDAAVAEALRKEGLAPLSSLTPAAPAKVVDLADARARRGPSRRWMPLLAAAAVAALIGKPSVDRLMPWAPVAVSYPTHVPAPTAHQLADVERRLALRLCAMGYWGECLEQLDHARSLDPGGDDTPEVKTARTDAERLGHIRPGDPEVHPDAKLPLGPGEKHLEPPPKTPLP